MLSVKQLAKLVGVCPATLYKLVRQAKVGCVRVGNSIRFRPEDVEALIRDVDPGEPA